MATISNVTAIIIWLVMLVVLIGIEIATLGLTTIWFAAGALVSFILALFKTPFIVQVIAFLVVSILMFVFTRPIALKYFNKETVKTNVDSIAGKQAIVVEEINNLLGKGRATLSGNEWTARGEEENAIIPVGSVVTVVEVKGVKLIVKNEK